jgi:hypothetical protein
MTVAVTGAVSRPPTRQPGSPVVGPVNRLEGIGLLGPPV